MYDYLIVGAGLYGSVFAWRAKQDGKKCLVIDKRNHLGGNRVNVAEHTLVVSTFDQHSYYYYTFGFAQLH